MASISDDCDQEAGNQEAVSDELTALVDSTSTQRSALVAKPGLRALLVLCGMLGLVSLAVRQITPSISALQVANVSDGLIEASNLDAGARLPGIEYIFKGYNIFKGNPLPTTGFVDPGFTQYDIFDLQWAPRFAMDPDSVLVPAHVMVSDSVACNLDMNTVASNSRSSYKRSMDETLGVDISGTQGSFTAAYAGSLDFKHNVEDVIEKNEKLITSTAQCAVHKGSIDLFYQPTVSASLKKALDHMPADYGDGSKYFMFIDQIGTHYLKTITLGARYGMTASLSETGQKTLLENGMDIAHHASLSTATIEATADSTSTTSNSNDQMFAQNIGDMHVVTIGAKPPSGTQSEWLKQSGAIAMPIAYELAPLLDIIDDIIQPQQKTNMLRAYREYCEVHLGLASDLCSNPLEDPACMWDSDCSPQMVCNAGACEEGCSTSEDCAGTGFCRSGQCETLCQDLVVSVKDDALYLKDKRICPPYLRLLKEECSTYAEVQGSNFFSSGDSSFPAGCYLYSGGYAPRVCWNRHSTGGSNSDGKPICSAADLGLDLFTLKPDKMLHGAPTFWSTGGTHFIYYCKDSDRWQAETGEKSLQYFTQMQTDGSCWNNWHLPRGSPLVSMNGRPDAPRQFDFWSDHEWHTADGLVIQCSTCNAIQFSGFHHGYMNAVFKPIEEYSHGKKLWQDNTENNFLYHCTSDDMWVISNYRRDVDTGIDEGGICKGWAWGGAGLLDPDWSHQDGGSDTIEQNDWVHHKCINV